MKQFLAAQKGSGAAPASGVGEEKKEGKEKEKKEKEAKSERVRNIYEALSVINDISDGMKHDTAVAFVKLASDVIRSLSDAVRLRLLCIRAIGRH